jgi:hypothetical protein
MLDDRIASPGPRQSLWDQPVDLESGGHRGSGRVRQKLGSSVVLWRDGDLCYALASDLNGADLQARARRIADQR